VRTFTSPDLDLFKLMYSIGGSYMLPF
jgi:hypothetical protein